MLSILSDGDFSSVEETGISTPPSSNSSQTRPFTASPQLSPVFALQGRNLRPRVANRSSTANINKKRSYLKPRRSGIQHVNLYTEPQQTLEESLIAGRSLRPRPENNVLPGHGAANKSKPSQEQVSLISTESIIIPSSVREQTPERRAKSRQMAQNAAKPHITMSDSPETDAIAADDSLASLDHNTQSLEVSCFILLFFPLQHIEITHSNIFPFQFLSPTIPVIC